MADNPQRRSHWRAVVVAGIAVVGASIAVPVVYGATDGPATGTHAPMMTTMEPGHMTMPGHMMGPGMMTMTPAEMAEMMQSGHGMGGHR